MKSIHSLCWGYFLAALIVAGESDYVSGQSGIVADSPTIRVAGNRAGVKWSDIRSALKPSIDMSPLESVSGEWVIPWEVIGFAATHTDHLPNQAIRIEVDAQSLPTAIVIDRQSVLTATGAWKQQFAEWRAAEVGKEPYRLEAVGRNTNAVAGERRLLVIAGYQSQADEAQRVAEYLSNACGIESHVYCYPTDGAIDVSSKRLATLLQAQRQVAPSARWTIVGHSMGGLIARGAVELHSAQGVERLIQIFPPNHGSKLAEIAEPLDAAIVAKSQLMRIFASLSEGEEPAIGQAMAPAAVLSWISDGFALASRDLCPKSDFLQTINRRPRNESVQYTILTGTGGPMHPLVGSAVLLSGPALRQELHTSQAKEIEVAWEWIEAIVQDGQLVQGRGDGVVSVRSTKLPGVEDNVEIDCQHLAWSALNTPAGRRVMDEVLKRLK